MNWRKIFSASAYKQKLLFSLAKGLTPYMAVTKLVWGDEANIKIGENVSLNNVLINARSGKVTIEDNAFFGHNVMLLTGMHDMSKDGADRHEAVPESGRDIHIAAGAWVASGAIVIGPCKIGKNAVIGAGSVVSGDVPSGALHAGNPAKFLKQVIVSDD